MGQRANTPVQLIAGRERRKAGKGGEGGIAPRDGSPASPPLPPFGRQAVDIARDTRPDVVILDLEMPVLNGFDAAAAIRATLSPPPMLVAVSGAPAAVIAAEAGSVFDHAL